MTRLGVNIDHVATLRQARRGKNPNPVEAALVSERAGCDGIVAHLREDRRHIQEQDLWDLKKALRVPLNMEMSASPQIVRVAARVKPDQATLVPEKRQELTTEGGLDLRKGQKRLKQAVSQLKKAGIRVSLFIDPDPVQIRLARDLEVPMIELHTGRYAGAPTRKRREILLRQMEEAVGKARALGLIVAAGHGLDYDNVVEVVSIPEIEELNIGFSIVARAVEAGFHQAVQEMAGLVHGGGR